MTWRNVEPRSNGPDTAPGVEAFRKVGTPGDVPRSAFIRWTLRWLPGSVHSMSGPRQGSYGNVAAKTATVKPRHPGIYLLLSFTSFEPYNQRTSIGTQPGERRKMTAGRSKGLIWAYRP